MKNIQWFILICILLECLYLGILKKNLNETEANHLEIIKILDLQKNQIEQEIQKTEQEIKEIDKKIQNINQENQKYKETIKNIQKDSNFNSFLDDLKINEDIQKSFTGYATKCKNNKENFSSLNTMFIKSETQYSKLKEALTLANGEGKVLVRELDQVAQKINETDQKVQEIGQNIKALNTVIDGDEWVQGR